MLKIALTAAITAAICFCVSLSSGLAGTGNSGSLQVVRVGDSISVPALDLGCVLFASDPEHVDPGADMYCYRSSAVKAGRKSRAVKITNYHVGVTNEAGTQLVFEADRSP